MHNLAQIHSVDSTQCIIDSYTVVISITQEIVELASKSQLATQVVSYSLSQFISISYGEVIASI